MLFKLVDKKDILRKVRESIKQARREIIATMLLREEMTNPLPTSYFNLLKKKVEDGVTFKRLGFGRKEDYNKIRQRVHINRNNYTFRYISQVSKYQRLIIIDRKELYFGANGLFFQSIYSPLIKVFLNYFLKYFKKRKS